MLSLLFLSQPALLTGIAARRGSLTAQANLLSSARLLVSDLMLKVQRQLNPNLELYKLPQRDLLRTEEDLYTIAQAFSEKTRVQFLGDRLSLSRHRSYFSPHMHTRVHRLVSRLQRTSDGAKAGWAGP